MCTGRVDLSFILRAFEKGADGVFIGGCWPGECHYITEGNYDALANMHLCRKLMERIGISPERLRLEWIAASEGTRFAEIMDDFVKTLKELGPLYDSDDQSGLRAKLDAANKLVPYIRLVERERLRAPVKSEEVYNAFYASDEVNRIFDELIADKLVVSQILSLLRERPLSTSEIAEGLGLNPSEVSRQMNSSSRQGLVKYDVERRCYALASWQEC
jgi:F420-non-reducing hydrogenase iron-sulfur subunit